MLLVLSHILTYLGMLGIAPLLKMQLAAGIQALL